MGFLRVIRKWALRDKIPIREIARRTGVSRNTIKKYLREGIVEPAFQVPDRPSKLDPYLLQTHEMLFDAHWHAFRVFEGVPGRGIYDNMKTAVDRVGVGKPRRVIAKIEWHPGELFPRVGFIVTNLPIDPDWIVRFYNQRGTAEQHIKEGKYAFRWTRLSCRKFRDNEVRLQLHALAYNLATFLRCIDLPEAMADWSLTSLQMKLIKIGARVVRHARAITFQLAEVAVTGPMVRAILAAIRRLREPPLCA